MNNRKYVIYQNITCSLMAAGLLGSPLQVNAALEEIIVTANKRSESANSIGLSIAAVSGSKLADLKLTSLEEITSAVPGLVFATSQQNTPILALRGVGFNESSMGVYPATSLYVDEIPLPFPVMAAHSAYDLERVEVLKGPQGVLFGQNSTGGAINFIAAKPTEDLSYGADISYGRFNRLETNAHVSAPLGSSVGARLAIQHVAADDWQKSLTRNAENGEEDYTAGRLTLNIDPNDRTQLSFGLNAWTDKSDPQAMQLVAKTPKRADAAPAKAAAQAALPFASENPRSADWTGELSGDKQFWQASFRGDFDLSDSFKITTLLAHSDYEQDQIQDGDGLALSTADFADQGEIESTFAEIRFSGEIGDSVRWLLGANYEDSSTTETQGNELFDSTTNRPQTFFIHRTLTYLEQDIESYAAFGNIDYDLTEQLMLKVGARYTDTTIDAYSCNSDPGNLPQATLPPGGTGANVADFFNFLGTNFGTAPFTPIGIGDCFTLNLSGVPGEPYIDSLGEDNVSWRLGLDYQFSDDTLLYGNVSKGYKVGSFPVLAANLVQQLFPVTQESVMAYEIGFKKSLADSRVQLNGAAFYYDYEDKQERGKRITLFGPLDNLVNVDESTIQGLEADIVAQVADGLTLTAAVTYIDSEVKEYVGFDVYGNANVDFSGQPLPFTPEFTYSLDLDYQTALADGTLFMGLNLTGQSDSDAVFGAGNLSIDDVLVPSPLISSIKEYYFQIESYSTLSARLGYETADNRWRFMLWGKNITDEYYYNSVISSSEGGARIAGRPATYGVTVAYQFN
ncbi:MAG: TonB-dependent receptor [Porticoccaceae bacterium]